MAAIEIPTNWSWSHFDRFGSRGPSAVEFATAVSEDLAALNVRVAAVQAAMDGHLARAGVHTASDVDNVITSPAATDPTADILALVNDCYTQYEAHRVLTAGSVHGAADATNVVTATAPATTEAEAIALMNDVKAMYELHRVLTAGSVHGAADSTNTIASADATDWDSLVTLANEFKNTTGFEAHRVLTAGSVHGAADSTNVITAADSGAQITALQTELAEFKTDFNAHIAHLGVHPTAGTANATAAATDEATAVALANGLKATINTHMASADDHLDADTTAVAAADATEYEDILTLVAELRADFNTHKAIAAYHLAADPNTLGTGGAVTINTVMGSTDT